MLVGTMFLKINLVKPWYILLFLVLPIVIMFFREPLGCLMEHKKYHVESVGDFIASNFFEVFEFLLSYATNTLSFVRIGGFVFSHAGMMSVVMMLSKTASAGASPLSSCLATCLSSAWRAFWQPSRFCVWNFTKSSPGSIPRATARRLRLYPSVTIPLWNNLFWRLSL